MYDPDMIDNGTETGNEFNWGNIGAEGVKVLPGLLGLFGIGSNPPTGTYAPPPQQPPPANNNMFMIAGASVFAVLVIVIVLVMIKK